MEVPVRNAWQSRPGWFLREIGPVVGLLFAVVLLVTRCGDSVRRTDHQGPMALHRGTIQSECAPWDGPAYRIVLASGASCATVPAPRLEVWVYRGFPITAESRLEFGPDLEEGAVAECDASGRCVPASEGVIEFDSFEEGVRATGTFDAILPDGRSLRGRFDVAWCASTPICG